MSNIRRIIGREILDSRGNPTVEAVIQLESGITARAGVPSGASTGSNEAVELRDGDKTRYNGRGVLNAVEHINGPINCLLAGKCALDQEEIDGMLCELDGSPSKEILGANAILAASVAVLKAAAAYLHVPLYRYVGGLRACCLPRPMMNVVNAGAHSGAPTDFQEFMICPVGIDSYSEGLRACVEIFHTLKKMLIRKGFSASVGDEGGFAPPIENAEAILELIMDAIREAGYRAGRRSEGGQIALALDCAASEFYDADRRVYQYRRSADHVVLNAGEQVSLLDRLVQEYPIDSIEDGMAESDWEGWCLLTRTLGKKIRLVGDDLLVTNVKYLRTAIERQAANAALIKMNQAGTVTETLNAVRMAQKAGWQVIVSHRSGETCDTTIADLAVGCGADRIKAGSASRGERIAKYNRLLRISEELGDAMSPA